MQRLILNSCWGRCLWLKHRPRWLYLTYAANVFKAEIKHYTNYRAAAFCGSFVFERSFP